MGTRRILLTGATGFLGGELLRRLLERDPRRIVCLVRAADDAEASRRGAHTHRRILGRAPIGLERSRVEWIRGDLELPGFGLSPDRYVTLASGIDEIFHCAASTRFDLPLAEAHGINVLGVRTVLRFAEVVAARGHLRRLHHVSTAFATGQRTGVVQPHELPSDQSRRFRNTYERTKARAERLLRSQRRVPCTIYRPSIIVGDSRSGQTTSWTTVYFPMRLMATGSIRHAPRKRRQLLDCVPVDFVADGILSLARRPETVGGTYHLTAGPDAMTVEEVIFETYAGLARHRNAPLEIGTRLVGPLHWWCLDRAHGLMARGRAQAALRKFRHYLPYTRVSAIYDNQQESALLAKDGLSLPPPREFFPRVVDYALRTEFGRVRVRPGEAGAR